MQFWVLVDNHLQFPDSVLAMGILTARTTDLGTSIVAGKEFPTATTVLSWSRGTKRNIRNWSLFICLFMGFIYLYGITCLSQLNWTVFKSKLKLSGTVYNGSYSLGSAFRITALWLKLMTCHCWNSHSSSIRSFMIVTKQNLPLSAA